MRFLLQIRKINLIINFRSMSSEIDAYFNSALKYTKKAGQLIKEKISESKNAKVKSSDIDLVTETDVEVEKLLINGLSSEFPDHKFIGEESVAEGTNCVLTNAPTWIIDPIDGTLNFIHTFPHSCISLALFINSEPAIGIIYNPMLEQLFTAKKGQGAYYNGKKINVSGQTELSKALLVVEIGTSRDPDKLNNNIENLKNLTVLSQGLRSVGSAALNLAMVALGGADAYHEFGIHIWDIAAGEIIITEAGGVVVDPLGGPIDRMSRRVLAAATPQLAAQLSQNLVQFYPLPRD